MPFTQNEKQKEGISSVINSGFCAFAKRKKKPPGLLKSEYTDSSAIALKGTECTQ